MKYIKTTHDVLGLEDRVKIVIKTNADANDISAISNVILGSDAKIYSLYRKPSKSSTQMWVTLKEDCTPEQQTVDDTLNGNSATAEGEVLVKVTVTGVASGLDALNAFAQGPDAAPWGCYGPATLTLECRRCPQIKYVTCNLKPRGYESNIPSVHTKAFRGVRPVVEDYDTPEDGMLTVYFPV